MRTVWEKTFTEKMGRGRWKLFIINCRIFVCLSEYTSTISSVTFLDFSSFKGRIRQEEGCLRQASENQNWRSQINSTMAWTQSYQPERALPSAPVCSRNQPMTTLCRAGPAKAAFLIWFLWSRCWSHHLLRGTVPPIGLNYWQLAFK